MLITALAFCGRGAFRFGTGYVRAFSSLGVREKHVKIHPAVKRAVAEKRPVVALESTIITHGMPYPENFKTAVEVEEIVRRKSAEPATIAVLDGQIHVGLSHDDLHELAKCRSAVKISKRGLPAAIVKKQTGGTTVSATMLLAHWCNIPIFVTGGIGGVHRHGESTMDISSDLTELGQTPVTVVSAGIKSILDIPRTLEYLETQGVPVVTFGQTTDFPAFFTPVSGSQSQLCVRNASEAAELIHISSELKMGSGYLIGVPIPSEFAAQGDRIENAIKNAVAEAEKNCILGAEVTPFILERVNELTVGESLKANIALIKNNASVGAEIACELARLRSHNRKRRKAKTNRPVVIGGTSVDIVTKCGSDVKYHGPSNPANISLTLGGVGRNVAEGLCRLSDDPIFLTALGDDAHADTVEKQMKEYMDLSFVERFSGEKSAIYNVILNGEGGVELAGEEMTIHDRITPDVIKKNEAVFEDAPIVCLDGNVPIETMSYICQLCKRKRLDLFFEPTGSLKAGKLFEHGSDWQAIKYTTPNLEEFDVMVSAVTGDRPKRSIEEKGHFTESMLKSMHETCRPLLEHIYCLVVTLEGNGVVTFVQDSKAPTGIKGTFFPLHAMPKQDWMSRDMVSVSGSGDTFAAAFIHGLLAGKPVEICTKMGIFAAQLSVRSTLTVPQDLKAEMLKDIAGMEWDTYDI